MKRRPPFYSTTKLEWLSSKWPRYETCFHSYSTGAYLSYIGPMLRHLRVTYMMQQDYGIRPDDYDPYWHSPVKEVAIPGLPELFLQIGERACYGSFCLSMIENGVLYMIGKRCVIEPLAFYVRRDHDLYVRYPRSYLLAGRAEYVAEIMADELALPDTKRVAPAVAADQQRRWVAGRWPDRQAGGRLVYDDFP